MEYKFRVARFLYDRYESDLLMLHIWGTDRIQHELWNFFDEGHRQFRKDKKEKFYDKILSYYQKVDSEIDALIKHVGEDSNIIVLSDHGFGPTDWMIDLNALLLKNSFIKIKDNTSSRIKYFL